MYVVEMVVDMMGYDTGYYLAADPYTGNDREQVDDQRDSPRVIQYPTLEAAQQAAVVVVSYYSPEEHPWEYVNILNLLPGSIALGRRTRVWTHQDRIDPPTTAR